MLYETCIINGCLAVRYLYRAEWSFTAYLLLKEDVEDFDRKYSINGHQYHGVRYNILDGKCFPYDSNKDDWWGTTIPANREKEFLNSLNY